MKLDAKLASLAVIAVAGTSLGLGAPPAHAATSHGQLTRGAAQLHATRAGADSHASTVFVQDDNPAGNTIHVYDRTATDGLSPVGTYPTGGNGGVLDGSVVDHLASEGSLTYDAGSHLLYAVNAGSDTVTVFRVDGDHLVRRQTVSSGGQFPVSIAARGGRVFVLNARNGGTVTGFLQVAGFLVPIPAWTRPLGLDPSRTPEFTSTPGQVSFTPDGSKLIVTTKNGANTVDVFPISLLGPAAKPTITSLPGTVPFGFDFDTAGHLVLTEAGPNAVATFAIERNGELTQLSSQATGQAATCWVVSADGVSYLSNAGSGTVSLYRSDTAGSLTALGTTAADSGTVDATVSGDDTTLYVQNGAQGVLDAFHIGHGGSLTKTASLTVPDAIGAQGIAAS